MKPAEYIKSHYGEDNLRTYLRYFRHHIPERFWLNPPDNYLEKVKSLDEYFKSSSVIGIMSGETDSTIRFVAEFSKMKLGGSRARMVDFNWFYSEHIDKFSHTLKDSAMKVFYGCKWVAFYNITYKVSKNIKEQHFQLLVNIINSLIYGSLQCNILLGMEYVPKDAFHTLYGDEMDGLLKVTTADNQHLNPDKKLHWVNLR